jgi:DNA-binding protein HU-beta
MTTKELTNRIAVQTGMTKKQADELMTATSQVIMNALNSNQAVQLKNFGTLTVKERAAREVTNPKTGAKTLKAAQRIPVFRPNRQLKDEIR